MTHYPEATEPPACTRCGSREGVLVGEQGLCQRCTDERLEQYFRRLWSLMEGEEP